MWLVAEGFTNNAIADELGLSPHTVKFHIEHATTKLGYTNRTGGAVKFVLAHLDEARERWNLPASPTSPTPTTPDPGD